MTPNMRISRRTSRGKSFSRALARCGADIHDPKARKPMTLGRSRKFVSEKHWPISFPGLSDEEITAGCDYWEVCPPSLCNLIGNFVFCECVYILLLLSCVIAASGSTRSQLRTKTMIESDCHSAASQTHTFVSHTFNKAFSLYISRT